MVVLCCSTVECAFADDLVIFARNKKELQYNLQIWNDALHRKNMKINTKKTTIMTICKDSVGDKIRLNGGETEKVEAFKYLGANIHKNGKNDAERNESTTKVYYAITHNLIRKK
ncbi:unnamed protein product [Callosobruchus maculatus]|uniref:Reverse transcriptase domain-containing protein n=1 Tax=Callosobruchus maculatus TaxID=64391 RepID=A0A653CKT1_CALMS|nr:unnamed protein product [Callosobruchus maculatus]